MTDKTLLELMSVSQVVQRKAEALRDMRIEYNKLLERYYHGEFDGPRDYRRIIGDITKGATMPVCDYSAEENLFNV